LTKLARVAEVALARVSGGGDWQHRVDRWLKGKAESSIRTYSSDFADFVRWAGATSLGEVLERLFRGDSSLVRLQVLEVFLEYTANLRDRPVWASTAAKQRGDPPARSGLAPATVARRLSAFRILVALGQDAGLCPEFTLPKSPKVRKYRDTSGINRTAYLTILDALDTALDAAAEGTQAHYLAVRDRAVILLLHDCALRRVEVVRLGLEDIAADGQTMKVWGKNRSAQEKETLPLARSPGSAVAAWVAVRGRSPGPLFTTRTGKPLGLGGVSKLVMRWGERAGGFHCSPHQLRHAAITSVAQLNGGNMVALQAYARHRSADTTQIYIDNMGETVRATQELLGELGDS